MFEVMITLFVIVVVGYAAGKLGYMGGDFDRKLSSLVINWTCPALILSSSMTGDLPDRQYILPLLGISVLTYVVLTALAWGFSRLLTKRIEHRGILSFAMVFILPSFVSLRGLGRLRQPRLLLCIKKTLFCKLQASH